MAGKQQHGGKREGAGRPKGSLNKRSIEAIEAVAKEYPDWSPLKHLARVANDETLDADIRLDAAKAAAPYVHPKPKGVEMDPDALVDLERRIAEVRYRSARENGFSLDGLADRLTRAKAARAVDPVLPPAIASPRPVQPQQAPEPAKPAPAAQRPALAAPEPAASTRRHDRYPEFPSDWQQPAAPYRPIVDWPDQSGFAEVDYDPTGGSYDFEK